MLPLYIRILCGIAIAATPAVSQSQIDERDVAFHAGTVTLAGTLLTPHDAGRHPLPAIALLSGSGPGPRQQLRLFADRFARLGFAALIFDKRGSGSSEGSWTDESLDDLADDALAAVSFLRAQPGIDGQRVGVWGVSQAGWVIPRAAARAPDAFAFAVIVTGGGIPPLEIEQTDYASALERAGFAGDDRRAALVLVEQYCAYLKSGKDRAALEHSIEAARTQPWFKAVDVSRVLPSESARSKWAWITTYDPAPDVRKMKMPVLVVLGEKDRPSLSAKALASWRENLTAGGNSDATVVEFLNAEHGAAVAGTHRLMHNGGPPTYVPGYLEMLDAWLLVRGRI
jgi:uncharacterized protein